MFRLLVNMRALHTFILIMAALNYQVSDKNEIASNTLFSLESDSTITNFCLSVCLLLVHAIHILYRGLVQFPSVCFFVTSKVYAPRIQKGTMSLTRIRTWVFCLPDRCANHYTTSSTPREQLKCGELTQVSAQWFFIFHMNM